MTDAEKYDLMRKLANELGVITVIWSKEDVLELRPDLTEEQAADVLVSADRRHDANIGINWEVLQFHADYLFPSKSKEETS